MGKLTAIKKNNVSESAVKILEQLLKEAKEGKFRQIAFAIHVPPTDVGGAWSDECGNTPWGMLGCLTHVTQSFRDKYILPALEPIDPKKVS